MARLDVPTLQCDRCKTATQDLMEMGRFNKLTGIWDGYGSSRQAWDMCPICWTKFLDWIAKGD
jgi:hypothetical protein